MIRRLLGCGVVAKLVSYHNKNSSRPGCITATLCLLESTYDCTAAALNAAVRLMLGIRSQKDHVTAALIDRRCMNRVQTLHTGVTVDHW